MNCRCCRRIRIPVLHLLGAACSSQECIVVQLQSHAMGCVRAWILVFFSSRVLVLPCCLCCAGADWVPPPGLDSAPILVAGAVQRWAERPAAGHGRWAACVLL